MTPFLFDADVAHQLVANRYRPQFLFAAIDFIVAGAADLLATAPEVVAAAAPEAAAVAIPTAAEATAAGVDIAAATGATALPAIDVTAAAPAVASAGGEAAGAAGAAAGAAGAGLTSADIVAGGLAGAGAFGATEALAGTAGPTTALNAPSLSFAPATTPANPLADVGAGGGALSTDAFAGAPSAQPGTMSADTLTALNTGTPGEDIFSLAQTPTSVGQLTAGTGIPTPAPMEDVSAAVAPQIPSAGEAAGVGEGTSTVAGAGPGVPAPAISNAPAGGGISNTISNILNSPALRLIGNVAPLGMLGYTLAKGQPSLPPAEEQAIRNTAGVQGLANQQLTEGITGQLQPGQAAQIQKYVTDAKNKLYQLYARMGRDPTGDTDYIQGLAQIDQNAQIMSQQFIDAAIANGLKAQGIVDATLQDAARLQVSQDEAFQSSISAALQSFGLVTALNAASSRGAAAAPTGG